MLITSDAQGQSFSEIAKRLLERLDPHLDATPGSVLRTLIEAYSYEMGRLYREIDNAYRAGFLDTADGKALDLVVSVLGVERALAGRLTGEIEISRETPAPYDVGIPSGFEVTGTQPDGKTLPVFETTEDAILCRGQTRVVVPVQQKLAAEQVLIEDGTGDAADVDAESVERIDPGQLSVMPNPIFGIDAVTNVQPILRIGQDENDDSLRVRARGALRSTQSGTLDGIIAAIRAQGIQNVTATEPQDGPPGIVEIVIGDAGLEDDSKKLSRVVDAIRRTHSAGVRVKLFFARTVVLELFATVEPIDADLDERGFTRLRQELTTRLQDFAAAHPVGTTVSRRKVEAVLLSHPSVRNLFDLTAASTDGRPRAQDGTGDWELRTLEVLRFGTDERPPQFALLMPEIYAVVVTVSYIDDLDQDETVRAVRAVLDRTLRRLEEDTDRSLSWNELAAPLESRRFYLKEALITARATGVVYRMTGASDSLPLSNRARFVIGGVQLVRESQP